MHMYLLKCTCTFAIMCVCQQFIPKKWSRNRSIPQWAKNEVLPRNRWSVFFHLSSNLAPTPSFYNVAKNNTNIWRLMSYIWAHRWQKTTLGHSYSSITSIFNLFTSISITISRKLLLLVLLTQVGTVWIIYILGDREYAHKQVNRTFKLDKAKKKRYWYKCIFEFILFREKWKEFVTTLQNEDVNAPCITIYEATHVEEEGGHFNSKKRQQTAQRLCHGRKVNMATLYVRIYLEASVIEMKFSTPNHQKYGEDQCQIVQFSLQTDID